MRMPFITSASILFWGWQTGLLPAAVLLIPVIELNRFIKYRWDFSEKDFYRISDFCTLILGGIVIYLLVNNPTGIIHYTVKWLPLIVFPVLGAQLYSTDGKIDIRTILVFARKNKIRRLRDIDKIDVTYPYIITCIISAGIGNHRGLIFYLIIFILAIWALFPLRSRRYSPLIWAGIISFAAFTGYFAHVGLYRMQEVVTEFTINYFMRTEVDPLKYTTAIGEIGKLKLSNRILMRVENRESTPILLREATYNAYRNAKWYATLSGFKPVAEDAIPSRWVVNSNPPDTLKKITIFSKIKGDKRILNIPTNTHTIENLNVGQLEKNSLGTVCTIDGPGFSASRILYTDKSDDRPPDPLDKEIPKSEKNNLDAFISLINANYKEDITLKTPSEKLNILKQYFFINFSYSLTQKEKKGEGTEIENFLFHTKKGHCEFYATTTVLLLRTLNIPARYSTGFLVHEYSNYEKMYIVRQRDAHAWTMAYFDGKWQEFDTTPPGWPDYELEKNGNTPLKDFLSLVVFKINRRLDKMTRDDIAELTFWVLVPLGLFLLFRLRSKDKITRIQVTRFAPLKKKEAHASGLYLVEEKLKSMGYERYPWETFAMWLHRITESGSITVQSSCIEDILNIHYKSRYSNEIITTSEKEALIQKTEALLVSIMTAS